MAALSAAGSFLGSSGLGSAIASGIAAKHQQKRQFKENAKARNWQHDERLDAQDWQSEQAEIDRNWQHDEAQIARDWNAQQTQEARDWELEQWNRNNEYNDPSAQRDRLLAAGFNPLGAGIGVGESQALSTQPSGAVAPPSGAMPSGASDPSVSVPQVNNPVGEALQSFLAFKQMELLSKKTDSEARNLDADADYKAALMQTENGLRAGKIEFMGVQIDLGKIHAKKELKEIDVMAKQIQESDARIKQIFQWCEESGARISMMDFQKECERRQLPLKIRYLGQQILLANQQSLDLKSLRAYKKANLYEEYRSKKYANKMTKEYIDSGLYSKDIESRTNKLYFESEKERRSTKSEFLYKWDNAWESIGKATSVLSDVYKASAFRSFGQKFNMPQSTENPKPSSQDVMNHDIYIP